MARALVTEPALILADEPTGNLDSRSSEDVMSVLAELNAAGRTVVLITHDHGIAQNAHRTLSVLDGVVRTDAEHEPPVRPAP
jgi:putative ABC transport system ATP-binding protein